MNQDHLSQLTGFLSLPDDQCYRAREIHKIFDIGLSTWWKWVQVGRAPPGIKLSSRTTVWTGRQLNQLSHQLQAGESAA